MFKYLEVFILSCSAEAKVIRVSEFTARKKAVKISIAISTQTKLSYKEGPLVSLDMVIS
jgi:hypothetical protein